MSSHIHLVLQLGNDPLGRLTKQVHAPFGIWINQQKQKKGLGAVFGDRPKSVLVHTDTHGMALLRYVHNNPVRAGVVARAQDSDWSSHRSYLGLAPCPPWLATEAVLGTNEPNENSLRRDLASFVDEGRHEGRIPEFSGEVSNALARHIRKMMGGDVELSYPVLGPDEFVLSALKEQIQRHGDRREAQGHRVTADAVVKSVFESLSLEPGLANQRTKVPAVSQGRALAVWLWVVRLGRPQIEIADTLGLSPGAVSMMLSRKRRQGLTLGEKQRITRLFNNLTKEGSRETSSGKGGDRSYRPKVVILKRQRR